MHGPVSLSFILHSHFKRLTLLLSSFSLYTTCPTTCEKLPTLSKDNCMSLKPQIYLALKTTCNSSGTVWTRSPAKTRLSIWQLHLDVSGFFHSLKMTWNSVFRWRAAKKHTTFSCSNTTDRLGPESSRWHIVLPPCSGCHMVITTILLQIPSKSNALCWRSGKISPAACSAVKCPLIPEV